MQTAALTARFVLAFVFLLAGLAKLPRRGKFAVTVARFELLPDRWVHPFAMALPVVEIATGSLLAIGAATRVAAAAAGVVLVAFTAATASSLLQGKRLECGCFGPGAPRPLTWLTVARNVGLVACAAVAALAAPRVLSVDAFVLGRAGGLPTTDAIALGVTALVAVLAALTLAEAVRAERIVRSA